MFYPQNRSAALDTIDKEFKTGRWVFRVIGFLVIWIGLNAIFTPFIIFFDIIPFFGKNNPLFTGFIYFSNCFVANFLTILFSLILNNLWALILVLVIFVALISILVLYFKKKAQTNTASKTSVKN